MGVRAGLAAGHPGLCRLQECGVTKWRHGARDAADGDSRLPGPGDQVSLQVIDDAGTAAAAVAFGILQMKAQLPARKPLPSHAEWRQMPIVAAGNAAVAVVARSMAGRTPHAGRAMSIRSPHDVHLVPVP